MSESASRDDLERRIEQLERRVGDLEDALEDAAGEAQLGTRDRYDADVLMELDEGVVYPLRALRAAYERAGVRDRTKIKDRIKHLERSGLLERDGTSRWRFTGGGENT